MENKQLKENIKRKMIPISKRLSTESKLFLYNESLIKLYKSQIDLENKKRILEKLNTFNIDGCLIPTYALYTDDILSGIEMDYLYDYDALYDILNDKTLDFETRKIIAIKICNIILEIENNDTIYHDIHEDNFLIRNESIKVIDMDNILLPYRFDKYEYEINRLESRRRLIYLCIEILLNTSDLNINTINNSCLRTIYTLSNPKQKELYNFVFLDADSEINPLDYIDYFSEDYVQCIKKIINMR